MRVGLIGFGYPSKTFHAPLLRATEGFRTELVSSRRPAEVAAAVPGAAVQADAPSPTPRRSPDRGIAVCSRSGEGSAINHSGDAFGLRYGRFSEGRKVVLDALREELRKHDYLPILFDFPPSPNQATLETVNTLASMARFVVADLTDARIVLMELGAIVPAFPSVAARLMIKKPEHEYGMLDSIRLHRSVVEDTYEYEDVNEMIASIRVGCSPPFGQFRSVF